MKSDLKQSLIDKIYHRSVLLKEAVDLLQVRKGEKYIDATLGGGGHAFEIINRGGIVLGIDTDQDALDYVQTNLKSQISNLKLIPVRGNFRDIDKLAHLNNFEKVFGIIFDLGVSSFQIENPRRGFSFQKTGELDMRMSGNENIPKASDILNLATKDELNNIFTKFGEEKRAFAIAGALVRARGVESIETTDDLLKIIQGVYGLKGEISDKIRANISKRIFQALRIAVNDELENLKKALPKAISLLGEGGRLAVISFHSLEDKIVKEGFKLFENQNMGRIITKKPLTPSLGEVLENPRARSAKLRVFERKIENA